MRKILILLTALVALAAVPSLASADNPSATYNNTPPPGQDAGQSCSTPWASGVYGQYGARGFFIDGCTAVVRCPAQSFGCNVHASGTIGDRNYAYDTMNARLRMFTSSGSIIGWKDASCPIPGSWGYQGCTTPQLDGTLGPGGIGTVQCNGVRGTSLVGLAADTCRISLFANYVR